MESPYTYSTLDANVREIRLLKLEHGSLDDPIVGLVVHASLDAKPLYFALSYVWGPTTLGRRITLGGHVFPVTDNLFTALQFLRRLHEKNDVLFWVDAICINQESIPERESQVALMGSIYSHARITVCWLGRPTGQGMLSREAEIFSLDEMIGEELATYPRYVLLLTCDRPSICAVAIL
jgi:hypothetical protein